MDDGTMRRSTKRRERIERLERLFEELVGEVGETTAKQMLREAMDDIMAKKRGQENVGEHDACECDVCECVRRTIGGETNPKPNGKRSESEDPNYQWFK